MNHWKIDSIINVTLEDNLLELHFNVSFENMKRGFSVEIGEDGETIIFNQKDKAVLTTDIHYPNFHIVEINAPNDLSVLLGSNINAIQLGRDNKDKNSVYYFSLKTDKQSFIFYNNGDQGAYSFNKSIEEVLAYNIYEFEWTPVAIGT